MADKPPTKLRKKKSENTPQKTSPHWRVAIVGAGFGGLGTAVKLQQTGVKDFVIFEKGPEVGGIWQWNQYPGCGCDVPSQLYSFSFAKYRDSKLRYPNQPEILSYLCSVADDFDLRPHLRLSTPVASAIWSDRDSLWILTTESGEQHTADSVIFAVGQLHRPFTPKLNGHGKFRGPAFHTAQWDHSVDITGKKIAVIGTGSSAAQMIPELAKTASQVDVYQRTANWVIPKPSAEFGPVTSRMFKWLPGLQTAFRAAVWFGADFILTPVITRGWSAKPVRWIAQWHLRRQVADPVLRRKLMPDHEIGCKRIVIDSKFYPALTRSNVTLITEPISQITSTGIKLGSDETRKADILLYATGFKTSEFLVPLTVKGRGGADLQERWQDGAEAYLGLAMPEFPNMFTIHGPNTILGHNSNVFIIEQQVGYVINCLRLIWQHKQPIEIKPGVMENYRTWLEASVGKTVWKGDCRSWYKNAQGKIVNPWPESTRFYRRLARRNPADAFESVNIE